MMRYAGQALRSLLALPTVAWMLLFFLVPLALVIVYSFATISLVTYDISFGWTLSNYRQIHDPLYFDTLTRSLFLSVSRHARLPAARLPARLLHQPPAAALAEAAAGAGDRAVLVELHRAHLRDRQPDRQRRAARSSSCTRCTC